MTLKPKALNWTDTQLLLLAVGVTFVPITIIIRCGRIVLWAGDPFWRTGVWECGKQQATFLV